MAKEKGSKAWIIIVIIIIAAATIFILASNKIIGCKTTTEYKTETYTETVGYKNCDYDRDCRCIHKSLLGLGACDSCRCTKTRQVPTTVEKCWFD